MVSMLMQDPLPTEAVVAVVKPAAHESHVRVAVLKYWPRAQALHGGKLLLEVDTYPSGHMAGIWTQR